MLGCDRPGRFITLNLDSHEYTKEMKDIFQEYNSYSIDTHTGKHGKTAQLWLNYIQMIHHNHEYSRRVGDLDLSIAWLPKITNYVLRLNHPNYARWLVMYHDHLFRLPETHPPEVHAEFRRIIFSIRRTTKPFSGSPIDLTLMVSMQTQQISGLELLPLLNLSLHAIQCWVESYLLRFSVISHVFDSLAMSKKEYVWKRHRIKNTIQVYDQSWQW